MHKNLADGSVVLNRNQKYYQYYAMGKKFWGMNGENQLKRSMLFFVNSC